MNELIAMNTQKALLIILPMITILLAIISTIWINSMRRRTQENNGIAALEVLNRIIEQIMRALNQTMVKYIRRRITGSISSNQCKDIKNVAINSIYSSLNEKIKKDIKYIVKDLDLYIDIAIESKIKELKDE